MQITLYTPIHKSLWDDFVRKSKNGNFIFYRNYMEYHHHRFSDHSLMIFDRDVLIAILPGHIHEQVYCSHNGLTYGGFLTDINMKTPVMLELFKEVIHYLQVLNCKKWLYKTIPYIHHKVPAEEDRYALFLNGAQLWRRDVMPVVPAEIKIKFQERRARGIKKAIKSNISVKETLDIQAYWKILTSVLWEQHQTKPVHSLEEIEYLQSVFPNHHYESIHHEESVPTVLS